MILFYWDLLLQSSSAAALAIKLDNLFFYSSQSITTSIYCIEIGMTGFSPRPIPSIVTVSFFLFINII